MEQLEEKINEIQEKIKLLIENLDLINSKIEKGNQTIKKLEVKENELIYENIGFVKSKKRNNIIIIFLTFLLAFHLNKLIETKYLNAFNISNLQIIFWEILEIISFFIPIVSLVNYYLKTRAERKKLKSAKEKIHIIRNKIYRKEMEIDYLKNYYLLYTDAITKYKIILQELKKELEIYQQTSDYLQITPSFSEFLLEKEKQNRKIEDKKVYKLNKK